MVISAINHSCGSYKPTYLTMGHHLVGLVQLHSIILRQNTKIPLPALTGTSPRARSLQSDGGEAMPGWKSGAIYRNTKHNKVLQVSLKHNITVTYANEDVSKIGLDLSGKPEEDSTSKSVIVSTKNAAPVDVIDRIWMPITTQSS